ncbi:MAG: hypothetical protein ABSF71_16665 [Terriglobia bacterium]
MTQAHHPVFMVAPLGETEFTSIVYAVIARPKGWTVREARAIEENLTHDLQTGIWRWEDLPSETWARARELARCYAPAWVAARSPRGFHPGACRRRFLHFDRDQAQLARATGLRVLGACRR